MSEKIKFILDDKVCYATPGQTIMDAARDNGIFIPSLCYVEGVKPAGSCRICNVKVNGRNMTACTTPVAEGMVVENNLPDLEDMRKAIVEVLFVAGNHFCPACEKSGNCELQALGYRYQMMVPRFPYEFPLKGVNAKSKFIYHDRNRCIVCKRCVRIVLKNEKPVFALNQQRRASPAYRIGCGTGKPADRNRSAPGYGYLPGWSYHQKRERILFPDRSEKI